MGEEAAMMEPVVETMREFRVVFDGSVEVAEWEAVFVSGSLACLGAWDPLKALPLQRQPSQEDGPPVWSAALPLAVHPDRAFHYRFFVAQFLDPYTRDGTAEHRRELCIANFENFHKPRSVHVPVVVGERLGAATDRYGRCEEGGKEFVDEGWLLRQSEVRLRLTTTTFWKSRYKDRRLHVKVTPVDLRYREIGQSLEEEEESRDEAPTLPSHTPCLLSVMGEDGYQGFSPQEPFGHHYDETQFHVFRVQTVAPAFLAFRFDFYMGKAEEGAGEGGGAAGQGDGVEALRLELVGVGHFMPSNDPKETRGTRIISISSLRHHPVGQFTVDHLMIHPLAEGRPRGDLSVSFARYWRKRRDPLNVGHRGLGNSYTKLTGARENTIRSLAQAAQHGADFVEFDVQLSKDAIPIVFHDFHVCVNVKRRQGSTLDLTAKEEEGKPTELYQLGVKDLKLGQLQLLKIDHSSLAEEGRALSESGGSLHVVSEEMMDEDLETAPFPTLADVLARVPLTSGFNVEIKSPLMCLDGSWETEQFWERNRYIDAILDVVLREHAGRRIVFSSFDPDVCSMLKMKQNRFPVLFLTQGKTQRYAPFLDKRANTSMMAVAFAASSQILGVNFHSEELLRDSSPLYAAQHQGLVSFVWGDDLDNRDALRYFRQLQVDGLIYDRIHSHYGQGTDSVFVVEKQQKDALLQRPPSSAGSTSGAIAFRADSESSSPSPPPLPVSGSRQRFNLSPPDKPQGPDHSRPISVEGGQPRIQLELA